MKRIILLVLVLTIASCSNDNGRGLTEGIGSIPFELQDTTRFNYFLPGAGTFEFQQNSKRSTNTNTIETRVRVKDNGNSTDTITFQMYLFKDADFTRANLDFVADARIPKQEDAYRLLSSNGSVKITDDNFRLSEFSQESNSISGEYSGTVRVFTMEDEDGQDDSADSDVAGDDNTDETNGENGGDSEDGEGQDNSGGSEDENEEESDEQTTTETTVDIFNVIGNIDRNNNLFLLSTKDGAEFNTLSGVLLNNSNPEFAGNMNKDSAKTLMGTFQTLEEVVVMQLSFEENGETKNLSIELNKNN